MNMPSFVGQQHQLMRERRFALDVGLRARNPRPTVSGEPVLALEMRAHELNLRCGTMAISTGSAWFTIGGAPQREMHADRRRRSCRPKPRRPCRWQILPASAGGALLAAGALRCGSGGASSQAASTQAQTSAANAARRRQSRASGTLRRRILTGESLPDSLDGRLSRQDGGIVHRRELLEQVGDVPFPETRVAEPGKGARKRRVVPAAARSTLRDAGCAASAAPRPA